VTPSAENVEDSMVQPGGFIVEGESDSVERRALSNLKQGKKKTFVRFFLSSNYLFCSK
jgi:hypothetical protein